MSQAAARSSGTRFRDIPPELYRAFALCATALSTAWQLKQYVDDGGGSAGLALELSQVLQKQVTESWDAIRAVELELLAVADGNCAHRVAIEFATSVVIMLRHEGTRSFSAATDGNINCHDLAVNWALVRERIGRIQDVDLKALSDRMQVEAARAARQRNLDGPQPTTGVTLLEAAMFLNEHDEESAKQTRARWQKSNRTTSLPDSIGKDPSDHRARLYNCFALAEFCKKVENISKSDFTRLLKHLQRIARCPASENRSS